jgi:hypothetical protein
MKRFASHRPSAAMVVAITALVFAMTGGGYAAMQLNGAHAAKKKKAKRGPAGPQGAPGTNGTNGTNGASAPIGAGYFGGHAQNLNTLVGIAGIGWSTPEGFSVMQSSSPGFNDILSPDVPITIKDLSVRLRNAPGTTSIRFLSLLIDDTTTSPQCVVLSNQDTCTVAINMTIPPRTPIAFQSEVSVATANGSEADFSWRAE